MLDIGASSWCFGATVLHCLVTCWTAAVQAFATSEDSREEDSQRVANVLHRQEKVATLGSTRTGFEASRNPAFIVVFKDSLVLVGFQATVSASRQIYRFGSIPRVITRASLRISCLVKSCICGLSAIPVLNNCMCGCGLVSHSEGHFAPYTVQRTMPSEQGAYQQAAYGRGL